MIDSRVLGIVRVLVSGSVFVFSSVSVGGSVLVVAAVLGGVIGFAIGSV